MGVIVSGFRTGTTILADVDLDIRQGAECVWVLVYSEEEAGAVVPNTFAGWAARSQIRAGVGGEVWHSMSSQAGGGITLTAANNKLTVTGLIPHIVTEAAAWDDRNGGQWDVELVRADGSVVPLAAGWVKVTHDITRGL